MGGFISPFRILSISSGIFTNNVYILPKPIQQVLAPAVYSIKAEKGPAHAGLEQSFVAGVSAQW
jgi:hypothetical protein